MKSKNPNLDREDAWMETAEFVALFIVGWLNPDAGIAIGGLKICFQILKTLRHHHR
jgi:hypothetical protein